MTARAWLGPLLEIAVALARGRRLRAMLALARLGQAVTAACRREDEIEGFSDVAFTALFDEVESNARAVMGRPPVPGRHGLAPRAWPERPLEG